MSAADRTSSGFPLSVLQQERFRFLAAGGAGRVQALVSIAGVDDCEIRAALARIVAACNITGHQFLETDGLEYPLQVWTADSPIDPAGIQLLHPGTEPSEWFRSVEPKNLFTAAVKARASGGWNLLLSLSPLIADMHTLQLLVCDLPAALEGREIEPPAIPFVQFSGWHRRLVTDADEQDLDFWRNYSHIGDKDFQLAFERRKATDGPFIPDSIDIPIPVEMRLQENVVAAAWIVLLWAHSGRDRITVGRSVNGRIYEELARTPGPMDLNLPVFVALQREESFAEVLQRVVHSTEQVLEHQEYFRWDLLQVDDPAGRGFPFTFEFAAISTPGESGPITMRIDDLRSAVERFRLKLTWIDQDGASGMRLDYDPLFLSVSGVESMGRQFVHMLQACLTTPEASIGKLVNAESEGQVPAAWIHGPKPDIPDKSISALIDEIALIHPKRTALVCGSARWSYEELYLRSNAMAAVLNSRYGIGPGHAVGFLCERSAELVTAILAILKTGAAFVPVDPSYPAARIRTILEASGTRALIVDRAEPLTFLTGEHPALIELPALIRASEPGASRPVSIHASHDDTAYILFTSGSTGKPKGCAVTMRSLVNYICWANSFYFGRRSCGDLPLYTSLSFDLTLTSLFSPLTRGRELHVYPDSIAIDEALTDCLSRQRLDSIKITPSHVTLLSELGVQDTNLITVIVGGEKLEWRHVLQLKSLGESVEIYNEYGPTEATVGCIVKRVEPEDDRILVGYPISNASVFIADEDLLPVAPGVQGEILIGGSVLAKGYLGNSVLTDTRFVESAFLGEQRVYRTGDVGRWMDDGQIEYLGRSDEQVKIRGHRVELDEIKAVVLQDPAIDQAVLTIYQPRPEESDIVCYVRPRGTPDLAKLRQRLKEHLPDYMVPSCILTVDRIPLTRNGKIDMQALPSPGQALRGKADRVGPRDSLEKRLAAIWEAVLQVESVGIHDDFFDAGGHSLKAAQVLSRIHKQIEVELHLRDFFDHPTIAKQAEVIQSRRRSAYEPIPPLQRQDDYPLSHAQRRLWILHTMEPQSFAYNMPGAFLIEGELAAEVLQAAYNALIARHEILRTRFVLPDGEPRQQILEELQIELPVADLSGLPDPHVEIETRYRAFARTPFDLEHAPLYRAELNRLGNNRWVLFFNIHHIVNDGWSESIFMRECLQAYEALLRNEPPEFAELRVQYKDCAAWLDRQLQNESGREHRQYWVERFKNADLPPLELPVDFRRPSMSSFCGASARFHISNGLAAPLKDLSKAAGASLFEALLAVSRVLLYRYSRQPNIVIGTPVAGRDHVDLENQLGFYVNTLALQTLLESDSSFLEVLEREKRTVRAALDHRIYPFDSLVDELDLPRDTSRAPLFDVMVAMQEARAWEFSAGGMDVRRMNLEAGICKFDLVFNFAEAAEQIEVEIDYNTDLFTSATIGRLFSHLTQLVHSIILEPSRAIKTLNLVPPEERALLRSFRNGDRKPLPEETIVTLFERTAAAFPDRKAVISADATWTYAELDMMARRIAGALQERFGIGRGEPVGVFGDRTVYWLASLLGAMMAGGAYVPLDPQHPEERLSYPITNSGCRILLGGSGPGDLPHLRAADPTLLAAGEFSCKPVPLQSSDLAYIIYTSGSTGTPKGVLVEHCGFVNMIREQIEIFGIRPDDRVLQFASAAFDASLSEVFMALLSGAAVVLIDSSTIASPALFLDYLDRQRVTVATVPPVYLSPLNRGLKHLNVLISAGEAPNPAELNFYAQRMQVFNAYGPTEASVCATFYRMPSDIAAGTAVPIGKPLANTSLLILDEHLEEMPIGAPGEIFLGGAGLARGYLGQPEMTNRSFVVRNAERLYRTGDWGKWLPDGNIVFLGRKDDQVKVHGHRIELEEVRQLLLRHAGVSEATVLLDTVADPPELAAFYISAGGLEASALRAFLEMNAAGFLIPSFLERLEKLPVTANGKIDRSALAARLRDKGKTDSTDDLPGDAVESGLLSIWEQVLNRTGFGVHANFFDLGGNSLRAVKLASGVHHAFGIDLPLKTVFGAPTVASMANWVRRSPNSAGSPIPQAVEASDYPVAPNQQAIWTAIQIEGPSAKFNMPAAYVVEGRVQPAAMEAAVTRLVRQHEVLRTVFVVANDEPRQRVLPDVAAYRYVDLLPAACDSTRVGEIVAGEMSRPFDIETGPLFRVLAIRTGEARFVLVIVFHHLIGDAWTIDVFQRALLDAYAQAVTGTHGASAYEQPATIRYRDYACWSRQRLQSEDMEPSKHFWFEQLQDWPVCRLPADGAEGRESPGPDSGHLYDDFGRETALSVESAARGQGLSTFMFLAGCVAVWLHRHTEQADVVVGVPFSGRIHPDLERQLGLFMNVVPLRFRIARNDEGSEFWSHVKATVLDASRHQAFPVETLTATVPALRDRGTSPLFHVEVHLDQFDHDFREEIARIPGPFAIAGYQLQQTFITGKYEVEFHFRWGAGGASVNLVYDANRFRETTARNWLEEIKLVIGLAAQESAPPISAIVRALQRQRQEDFSRRHRESFRKAQGSGSGT